MPEDTDVVVVRFSPFSEAGIEKSIRRQVESDFQNGVEPRQGLSVFADAVAGDEDFEAAVLRICKIAKAHVGGERVSVTTEVTLNQKGYALHLNEPPEGHYLVGHPDLSQMPHIAGLVDLFSEGRQKNPALGEGE